MPFGDGTGPRGQGAGTGRRGGMGGSSFGAGAGGYCICPNCKNKIAHQRGNPCYSIKCPKCGTQMTRE